MGLHSDISSFVNTAKGEVKTVPFKYFLLSYNGLIKEIELKRATFNTSNSLLQFQRFWCERVKEMKKNPEPTIELQKQQEEDCRRLTDINYRISVEAIELIRNRRYQEICLIALKEMVELMKEFHERYKK